MAQILKQSTAVDVLIGPFVDKTDGATAETGESPTVKLSKNGQTLAAKNDATTPVHDADGYYNCELDATDTNTVGTLILTVAASANALPVRHEFQVIEEATYDFLYASGATPIADINAECDTALSDYDPPTKAELDSGFSALNDPTAAAVADAVWDEALSGHTTAGSAGKSLADTETDAAAILVDTAEIGAAGAGLTEAGGTGDHLTAVPWNASWDAEVQSEVDDALVAQGLDHLVGASVTGTDVVDDSIVAKLVSASATADWDDYVNTTDSLQAIRDRGDAEWTTGAGGSPPDLLQSTTIATLASQTSFTLTAGSADDDAYNGALVVVTDSATSTQKTTGTVSDYTGSTKTVTLSDDPGIFTMAAGDSIDIIAVGEASASVDNAAIADAVWDEALSGHTTAGSAGKALADIETDAAAILVDTAEIGTAGAGLTDLGGMSTAMKAEVNAEADTALSDYDPPTKAELDSGFAALNDPTAAAVADAVWDEALSGHTTAGSAGKSLADTETDAAAILVDTAEIGTAGAGLTDLGGMSTAMKAEVNAEADTALSDYDPPTKAELDSGFSALNDPTAAAVADAVWDEALSGHTTAGSAGKSLADTETDAAAILVDTTEIGVAGAGLTEAGGTGDQLTGIPWNAAWDAEVQSEVDDALTAYGAATASDAASPAEVATEISDALRVDTLTATASVPSASPTFMQAIMWNYTLARNKMTFNKTSGVHTLRNDSDSGDIASYTGSDDGTTIERPKWTT